METINDINKALKIFEEASIIQVESSENGDYKTGNKNYNKIVKAVSFLKNLNSINSLFQFLDHKHPGPRIWSAYYTLPIDEKNAVKVLKELSNQPGIISLIAKTTLDEWKKGNLKFDS